MRRQQMMFYQVKPHTFKLVLFVYNIIRILDYYFEVGEDERHINLITSKTEGLNAYNHGRQLTTNFLETISDFVM